MPVLRLENINKVYPNGFHAVHDFSITINDGEFVSLVGPSGCGKSTLLRMIAGLEEITDGNFYIDDKLVNDLSPVDRNVSMVFQDYALYGNLTVYDNVGMSMSLKHEDPVKIYDSVMNTSEYLGVKQYLKRYPNQLSGGQKQRVALSRSMVRNPQVFLMDEPLSNLDAKLRVSTRAEIIQVQRKMHIPTVYVTHDQVEAMTMSDRIAVMRNGYCQQIGTPMEIYRNPVNLFVAGFIGMPPMNFIKCIIKDGKAVKGNCLVSIPNDKAKALSSYEGKKVVLGVRPEQIHLDPAGEVKLSVERIDFLGSNFEIHGGFDNTPVVLTTNRDTRIEEKEIRVSFDMEKVHFYDAESENIIV